MQWLDEWWVAWVLVAVGGAAGSALGMFLLRKPSPKRLITTTAIACGVLGGALRAYPSSMALTAFIGFGVLGSASSMVIAAMPVQQWLSSGSILRSALTVVTRLAVYCILGVSFAVAGYIAMSIGHTVEVKTR